MKEQKDTDKPRKSAPPVVVDDVFRDDRRALIDELDNNEYVHSFQSSTAKPEELRRKGLEVVKDSDGNVLSHGSDIVVRQPRPAYVKRVTAESRQSFEFAKRISKNEDDIQKKASPKKRKKLTEEE